MLSGQHRIRRSSQKTATRPGNPYLKAALGTAALSLANSHGTYLAVKYRRIAARRAVVHESTYHPIELATRG
jgi:hypothetical protein